MIAPPRASGDNRGHGDQRQQRGATVQRPKLVIPAMTALLSVVVTPLLLGQDLTLRDLPLQ